MTLKTVYYTDGKYIKFVQFTIFVIIFLSSVLCSFSLRFESWQHFNVMQIQLDLLIFFKKIMHRFTFEMFILHIMQDFTVEKKSFIHTFISFFS